MNYMSHRENCINQIGFQTPEKCDSIIISEEWEFTCVINLIKIKNHIQDKVRTHGLF